MTDYYVCELIGERSAFIRRFTDAMIAYEYREFLRSKYPGRAFIVEHDDWEE